MRHWIYHESEYPRIANVGDAFEDGWSDHPVMLTTDFGIDPDDAAGVQLLGETVEGLKDSLNGALNLREMKVGQLKEYARKHYGKNIKGKKVLLIAQIESFIHGYSD